MQAWLFVCQPQAQSRCCPDHGTHPSYDSFTASPGVFTSTATTAKVPGVELSLAAVILPQDPRVPQDKAEQLESCRRSSQVSGELWKGHSCVDSWELPSLRHRKGHGWSTAAFCRCPGDTAAKTTLICSLGPICCLGHEESSNH